MYATERQELIERRLTEDGRVSVVDLARHFDVTTETVRRDLALLEQAGVLRRVHGGAVPAERASTAEPSLGERLLRHGGAKTAIARRAAAMLDDSFTGSLFLDAGSTTAALAIELAAPRRGRIEVVTHALPIGAALAGIDHISLTAIGGRVRGLTAAAVGAETVRAIEGLRPDIVFLGANGLSAGFGLSTPDPDEAAAKAALVRAARRRVVLADAEKFDRELLVSFAALRDIDLLVTDAEPPAALRAALDDAGVEVWIA